jgi:glycosyltransferase involved in cell wall biosynthesis
MKVSVIVPCYNFGEYIEECIASILSQKTNFDYEILIRDDFSNDGSDKIIESYSKKNPNIKFFKSTENWGFNKNIRYLLEQSDAEYIAYIDGDDYWIDDEKLQNQIDFLDSNLDYSMCFCGYYRQENSDKSTTNLGYWFGPKDSNTDIFTSESFLSGNPVNSLTRVFRNTPNLFKEYFFDCHINDIPLNYEIAKLGKVKYLNFPGGVYRSNEKNMSNRYKNNFTYDEVLTLMNKTKELMLKNT